MTAHCKVVAVLLLAGLCSGACEYDQDIVLSGYYAEDGAKATTVPSVASSRQAQGSQAPRPKPRQNGEGGGSRKDENVVRYHISVEHKPKP